MLTQSRFMCCFSSIPRCWKMSRVLALRSLLARSAPLCPASCRSFATEVSTETKPLDLPPPSTTERMFSPKITSLVDDISRLNLLEVADLNECLKKTLRIEAVAMLAPGAAAAPAKAAEGEDEAPKQVKTAFTLRLTKFDDTRKVPLIKEVKNIVEGMNLVQAKKFVESAPQVLKTNMSKDEAEKMKQALEALGAIVEIE